MYKSTLRTRLNDQSSFALDGCRICTITESIHKQAGQNNLFFISL